MLLSRALALALAVPVAVLALSACAPGVSTLGQLTPAITLSPQPLPPPAPRRLAGPVPDGTVAVRPGRFDDRVALTGTRLSRGTVDASLRVAPDVREVVVLQAVADFYDAGGVLLGSTRQSHASSVGDDGGSVPLELAAEPEYRARVSSAVLSVPVLVDG